MKLHCIFVASCTLLVSGGVEFVGVQAFSTPTTATRSAPLSIRSTLFHIGSVPSYSNTAVASRIPSTILKASDEEEDDLDASKKVKVDPLVKETSVLLRRLSWFAWWAQLILTTVSSVTLLFAKNVIEASAGTAVSSPAEALATPSLPNFVLAGAGIALSFGSIFWTWAARRLARRLLKKPTTQIQAASLLRKSIGFGVTLNLVGMLTSLLSAEQIVGVLAIKVLTTSRTVTLLESSSLLQPLDILVVQANTNTLFSHFSSLVTLLYMTRSLAKLDPPSTEASPRQA